MLVFNSINQPSISLLENIWIKGKIIILEGSLTNSHRNTREVNYVQFCKEVDDFTEVTSSPEKKHQASTTYIPNDVINDVKNLDLVSNLYLSKRLDVTKYSINMTVKIV